MSGIELNDTVDLPLFTWEGTQWTPFDSLRHSPEGREEIAPGGWDHDHCIECHARFASDGDSLQFGYYSEGGDSWLCPACYEKYVAPNLDRDRNREEAKGKSLP